MRVRDTLRVAGGAGRVTHRRGLPFVDLRVREAGLLGGEELVVAQHLAVTERGRVAVTDDDERLDGLQIVDDAASNGMSESSTMMILSSAWLTTYASCSGNRRMLSVCSTAPMHGIAKYASRCSCVFQQNVPTRSPSATPSFVSAAASRSALSATSANDAPGAGIGPGDALAVGVHPAPVAQDRRDRQRKVLHRAQGRHAQNVNDSAVGQGADY